jgi:hypothetical protein
MLSLHNPAQRKFLWVIRASLAAKLAGFAGLLLLMKSLGIW